VSNQIERLRYYDGEYLRSYDFTAEQAYHIEMRRRLNHRLHLHGIVYGLEIQQDQDSPPQPPYFYSILPGMAIDHSGREIFVPAPYPLSSVNVLNRPGLEGLKAYEVWLCYRETQTGLPAAGYRDCNEKNQQTRWRENFQVVLVLPQSDAPTHTAPECGGVRLGTITLDADKQISGISDRVSSDKYRTYVGIRAQRLIAPNEEKDTFFDIKALNTKIPDELLPGYLDVHPGVFSHGNLVVKKNVVIGDDFKLDKNDKPNGEKLPGDIPATGNLKITSDLFLNGDFYGAVGGKWFLLKDYIQMLMPETVVGSYTIHILQSSATTGHEDVEVPTKLSNVTNKKVVLSISEIDWQLAENLPSFNKGAVTISVDPTLSDKGGGKYNLGIDWTVSPSATLSGSPALPVLKLVVSYVVVFTP